MINRIEKKLSFFKKNIINMIVYVEDSVTFILYD